MSALSQAEDFPVGTTPLDPKQLLRRQCTIWEAFNRLNDTGQGILLIVDDDGRLERTITDGDLRRLLVSGIKLDAALTALSAQPPLVAAAGDTAETMLERMNSQRIDHLPAIDAARRPIGVVHRRDVDDTILLSTPHLTKFEQTYVDEAFRTNWIAPLGPNVDAFERELAQIVGCKAAAAVSSGTAALHLALRLLGVGPGDRVFCSSLTFIASVNPVLYQGAEPVFIDSEPGSWNMSPQALERAFARAAAAGRLPKAVIVVNLYGQSADYDPIGALCGRYGVPIVEDAAESLGATYKGRASGTIGRIGIYSFNGNKIITTSGGGMLVSDNVELIERAKKLATQAREQRPYYHHVEVGYNYRMSNILAGVGRGQLKVLAERVTARRQVFERYRQLLADVPEIDWMPEAEFGRMNRWLSAGVLTADAGLARDELIQHLSLARIEARHVWKPMHLQPIFAGVEYHPHEPGSNASVSDELFERGFCLPSSSHLTERQQQRICDVIRQALGRHEGGSGRRRASAQA
jgi:dTDP-4-amino-4,6-dideoxygalactose transaminase